MMMKLRLSILTVLAAGCLACAFAGEKLSLKSITSGEFRPQSMKEVRPMADGETYAQMSDDGKRVEICSFRTGKLESVLFDATTARGPRIDQVDDYILSPDGTRMLIQTDTKSIYRHSFTATYYIYSIRNNKLEPLSDGGPQQTPVFSPDGNQIAFVRENNIYLVKLLYDNAESQVTTDGKQNEIINGIPDWVYEEEFSTSCSMVFSADSRQIIWIRYDESAVKQYSMQLFKGLNPELSDYAEYPGDYTYKYPVPGQVNSKVSVLSYDIQVCQLAVEDKVDKYIKEEVLEDIQLTDNHILLPSERDGYNHLYLYNLNGQLLRQIVNDRYVVKHVYGFDEKTGDTYFAANPHGATDQQVMVAHANGKMETLTAQAGVNHAIFSRNFKYFINIWSDIDHPTRYTLCQNNGKVLQTIIDNQELEQKLKGYELGRKELFSFKTSEGVELNGWMVKPADFNPSVKYPVIMYQYGGPGNQQVLNQWGIGMSGQGAILEQYLVQQGYICVCVDNRGTGGRGADFEKCTYLRLGELEARDQVETALWLGQQTYVDKERIGIWGWSYGGWNTLMSMSEGRPVFRAGVAIAPPTS